MYYIYKMIHPQSGRVYIGQHRLPKGKTPYNDGYFGSGKIWTRIYKKHPNECVKIILDFADTKEEVDALEIKYIAHYKAVWGDYCVNIAKGGGGGSGGMNKRFTDEELKEHARQRSRRYQNEHKEEIKAKKHERYLKNKEQHAKKGKMWRESHKDEIKVKRQTYYQEHKEEIKQRVKKYDKEHKEEREKYLKNYRETHKEEKRIYDRERRRAKKQAEIDKNKP